MHQTSAASVASTYNRIKATITRATSAVGNRGKTDERRPTMGSRKPSARAKKIAAFKASFVDADGFPASLSDPFAQEDRKRAERERERAEALRNKACESKNRYDTRVEAEEAIASCAAYGRRGLHCYQCPYCDGWHLTSKPER